MRATPAALAAAASRANCAIVAIEHGGAARLEAGKDFRLGVGDLFERAEKFQMHRLDAW